MAVQKHNTYYDNELYYYDENGVRKPLQVGKIYSAGSGIKIENDIISVSGKYVASASTALDGKRLVLVNNEWTELIIPSGSDWSQTIQEASAYAYSAATAWTDSQGYLTAHQIIPSAKWENASDIVETNSAKWNDGYNTLSSNSGNWVKKEELFSVSSTLNTNKLDISSFDDYKDLVNEELGKKQDKSAMSAYAFSSWVDENYQKKGNYLSANALDLISDTSGKWNEVSSKLDENDFTAWSANYDEYVKSIENDVGNLKSNSSNWDSVYNNVNTNSAKWDAASDEVTSNSANWNNVYESVHTNSGDWEEITKVKTFKTIGGIEAKTSADSLEFSAGENIEIGINEGKIFISSHDTTYDENDFISASHLDNIVSVSATVKTNSADWTSAAIALEASAAKWNTTHEQVNTSSVKWNELYDEYQVSSKLWNDTTNTVKTFSAGWNEVSAISRIDSIESVLANKKDKQTELNFTGSATKTINNISQNANGELTVEFADIDLPQEVPNVEITSEDKSIQVTETTDVATNTKKFDLSINVNDPLEYGQFRATNVNSQAQLTKINGNLELNNYAIKLKKGNSYHFTVRGSYVANNAVNTNSTIVYIEPISFNNINVNVDNTITDEQFFEISYDVYKLSSDKNYNVAFSSISGGKVSELLVEVHNLNGVSVNGQGGGGGGTTYSAGDAIDLTNDTISVKYGKGLEITTDNKLQLKVGNGLTLDNASNQLEVNTDVIATMEYVNGMIGNVEIQLSEL